MEVKVKKVSYKDIFTDLNISINQGEIVSIIGSHASGKTTLFNLICGYCKDFTGEIRIGEYRFNSNTKPSAIKKIQKKIAYLKQNLDGDLVLPTVIDEINLINSEYDRIKLKQLMTTFNLDENIFNKNYNELSNGEKKCISLIKVFISNCDLIILDDPTSFLDSKAISNLIKIIKQEKRNKKSILISTHDSDFILKSSDRIIAITNKGIIDNLELNSVLTDRKFLGYLNMNLPKISEFELMASQKGIRLMHRDNINDLIKDIFRNVK